MSSKPFPLGTLLLVTALGTGHLPLRAAEPAYPPPFSEVDKDGDGHIDHWEAAAVRWLPEYMRTLDQDGDGRLSPDEYKNLNAVAPGKRGKKSPPPMTPPAPTPMKP